MDNLGKKIVAVSVFWLCHYRRNELKMTIVVGGTNDGQDKITIWISLHSHTRERIVNMLSANCKQECIPVGCILPAH